MYLLDVITGMSARILKLRVTLVHRMEIGVHTDTSVVVKISSHYVDIQIKILPNTLAV